LEKEEKEMRVLIIILSAVLLAGVGWKVTATPSVPDFWSDVYPTACNELKLSAHQPQGCVLCHTSGGSPTDLNPYAVDIKSVHDRGGTWSAAIEAVEADDSDGDGFSNIDEILTNCTFPGDGTSPVEEQTWGMIKALYR